ncbi:hypothetical protein LguiA_006021 [Lonicera macranthoides]
MAPLKLGTHYSPDYGQGLWSFTPFTEVCNCNDRPTLAPDTIPLPDCTVGAQGVSLRQEPPEETFYHDPKLSYLIEELLENWDQKRRDWLKHHPAFATGASQQILVLTGSQPSTCSSPAVDHTALEDVRLLQNPQL